MSRAACRRLAAALGLLLAQAVLAKTPPACPPSAVQPTAVQTRQAAAQARDRGFLWRISKAGRSSYLYGTLHLGSLATAMPGPTVREALRQSDLLALELDMLDPDIQQRLTHSLQAAVPASPLPAALASRLRAQVSAACLAPAAVQDVPPLLQLTSLEALAARRAGLDPAFGVDAMLAATAHAEGKPVLSLETPESQVALLTDFSADEERELMAQGLADLESGRTRALLERTAAIWGESQLGELERYPQWCECLRDEHERRYMARLLDERNQAMAQSIARLHDEGRTLFVAVGSLHMIGPLGLPELLRGQGFELERITPR
jgi:uncharacterized protein YbaP (TraB family)